MYFAYYAMNADAYLASERRKLGLVKVFFNHSFAELLWLSDYEPFAVRQPGNNGGESFFFGVCKKFIELAGEGGPFET